MPSSTPSPRAPVDPSPVRGGGDLAELPEIWQAATGTGDAAATAAGYRDGARGLDHDDIGPLSDIEGQLTERFRHAARRVLLIGCAVPDQELATASRKGP